MKTLKDKYEKIVTKYIKQFEIISEIDFDYWVGDRVGEIACFDDYFFNFTDIKHLIDNGINSEYLFNWYSLSIEIYEKNKINFETFCKFRNDSEFKFKLELNKDIPEYILFENYLLKKLLHN